MAPVGHDIGLTVVYAYAQIYWNSVSRLATVDAPIPGTPVFDRARANPRAWHLGFHNAWDLAEILVSDRERQYLQAFFNARVFYPSAMGDDDPAIYAAVYAFVWKVTDAANMYHRTSSAGDFSS